MERRGSNRISRFLGAKNLTTHESIGWPAKGEGESGGCWFAVRPVIMPGWRPV